jgi:ubiquinone/menaquinone biosynthesis C-methylase UbiE
MFDRWASVYDLSALQDVLYRQAHSVVVQRALRLAPHARRVLDIGCGTGQLLRRVAAALPHADLVGVDASFAMASHTHEAMPSLRTSTRPVFVAVSRAEQLPFQAGAFDLVLSTLSARHWSDPKRAASEIRRVAARGAFVLIAEARPGRGRQGGPDPFPDALNHAGLHLCGIEPLPAASLLADVELIVATA